MAQGWSAAQVRHERLRRCGLLAPRCDSVASAARLVVGAQAQEANSAWHSLWIRLGARRGTTLEKLRGGSGDGLVRTTGKRTTLHFYAAEDWPLVRRVLASDLLQARMAKLDATGQRDECEAAVAACQAALRQGPALQRDLLADVSPDLYWGVRLAIAFRGIATRTDFGAGQPTLALASPDDAAAAAAIAATAAASSVDEQQGQPDLDSAMEAIALRYFAAFGPATHRDLAFWLGVRMTPVKAATQRLVAAGRLCEIDVDGGVEVDGDDGACAAEARRKSKRRKVTACSWSYDLAPKMLVCADSGTAPPAVPPATEWPARLLGRYETALMAHKSRQWLLHPLARKTVFQVGARIVATVLVQGRVCGTWTVARDGDELRVEVTPLPDEQGGVLLRSGPHLQRTLEQLRAWAEDLAHFHSANSFTLQVLA